MNKEQMKEHNRIAFYPCCNLDFIEPYEALDGLFDTFIFCDRNKSVRKKFEEVAESIPKARLLNLSIQDALKKISVIDILFYRRDSDGPGGSAIYVFGDKYFKDIAPKFSTAGAIIISDGSNARGANWRRMNRKNGLLKYDRHFIPHPTLDFSHLNGYKKIQTVQVMPLR